GAPSLTWAFRATWVPYRTFRQAQFLWTLETPLKYVSGTNGARRCSVLSLRLVLMMRLNPIRLLVADLMSLSCIVT
uniref:Neur_chan_LBD domain-containing protein n=1 Tax=Mesocestoides corti TaxID=53468 RepID=A0A5K3FXS1_MESCO